MENVSIVTHPETGEVEGWEVSIKGGRVAAHVEFTSDTACVIHRCRANDGEYVNLGREFSIAEARKVARILGTMTQYPRWDREWKAILKEVQ